jgi:hypothetical protein
LMSVTQTATLPIDNKCLGLNRLLIVTEKNNILTLSEHNNTTP